VIDLVHVSMLAMVGTQKLALLDSIPAPRKLGIIDACQAGASHDEIATSGFEARHVIAHLASVSV